jgi:type VI secretion system secreted protein Hcp
MRARRTLCARVPSPWAALLPLLLLATPAWSQAVTTEQRPEPPVAKVSKVEALTIKQSVVRASAYLKIGDIKGESTDDKHKGEIEVLSWSWGESAARAGTTAAVARPAAGPGKLTITKPVDSSSPELARAAASGRKFERMTVTLPATRPGGKYLTVTLRDVVISSVQHSSSGDTPTESVAFAYGRVD